MARVLVTGASGQVGGEVVSLLGPVAGLEVVAPGREEMDLGDAGSVRGVVRAVRPDWIVSAGAYTAVDKAESEPALAYAVNAEAVGVLGEEAWTLGAGVVHFSTDYVFDGLGTGAFAEEDATGPLGVYGGSKLAGEQALLASGAAAVILRTSWVYGATGKNFLRTILKLAREREELRVVGDQVGAPTWSRDLGRLAVYLLGRGALENVAGVYHATGGGETSWAGFAEEAIRLVGEREPGVKLAGVVGIRTAEYPTAARRPGNSRLSGAKLERVFGWRMMDWRESLRQVVDELGMRRG